MRSEVTLSRKPNLYGPPGPALFGIPFGGPTAGLGVLQTLSIVGSFLVALPMSLALPSSWSDQLKILIALAPAPLISFAGLHPVLAAAAFAGPLMTLFEKSPGARVYVFPTFYGASLDVAGLRTETAWGTLMVHFRGRWALPWTLHSLEISLQTPLKLRFYGSSNGLWLADARSEPAREITMASLAELSKACTRPIHITIDSGELRIAVHGCRSFKACWLALDQTLAPLMNQLFASDAQSSTYRDQVSSAARLEQLQRRLDRTRALAKEPPPSWWLAFRRQRLWHAEDLNERGAPELSADREKAES